MDNPNNKKNHLKHAKAKSKAVDKVSNSSKSVSVTFEPSMVNGPPGFSFKSGSSSKPLTLYPKRLENLIGVSNGPLIISKDPLASNSAAEANSSKMVVVVQPNCEQESTMSKTSDPIALPPPNPPSKGNLEPAIVDSDMTLINDVDTPKMAANEVVDTSCSIMQD
ncbi:hypothetical protein CCACVL1_13890 [Corchorus capsularis]|uniref:Uncharacterized protein n=1 Tax=Corchorus capsularis TaxID=210143 RepID=A0A1R3I962_COCAP|nr:hypothetical protein CCACVL1_13890 [Corchorus capsularis]